MKNVPPVTIIAPVDPPLANDCFDTYPSEECIFPGFEVEYIHTVINGMLQYPVKWMKVENFDGVAKALDSHEADIMGVSEFVDTKLINRWGYPPAAFLYDSLALLVREKYTDQSQLLVLLRSFSWDLWSIMILMSLVCITVRHASKSLYGAVTSFGHLIVKVTKFLLHKFRANICYAVWFILVSLLLNFYSNLIAVDLVAPETVKTVPFKTLNELGDKLLTRQCRLVMLEKYVNYSDVRDILVYPVNGNTTWSSKFVDAYSSNPPLVAQDRQGMVDMIMNNTCVVGIDWLTMGIYYNTRYCDMRVMSFPEELHLFGYTFYTSHRKDLAADISQVISSPPLQSYTNYLNDKYYSKRIPVDCATNRLVSVKAVNLSKIQDCFYVLAVGLIIAFIFICSQKIRQCSVKQVERF